MAMGVGKADGVRAMDPRDGKERATMWMAIRGLGLVWEMLPNSRMWESAVWQTSASTVGAPPRAISAPLLPDSPVRPHRPARPTYKTVPPSSQLPLQLPHPHPHLHTNPRPRPRPRFRSFLLLQTVSSNHLAHPPPAPTPPLRAKGIRKRINHLTASRPPNTPV